MTKTADGWKGDSEHKQLLESIDSRIIAPYLSKKSTLRVYHGIGCSACRNTGYQGRIGIFEVLEVTPAMSKLITARADSELLLKQAIKDGMTTLVDDGIQKVLAGKTTVAEVLRVTKGEL